MWGISTATRGGRRWGETGRLHPGRSHSEQRSAFALEREVSAPGGTLFHTHGRGVWKSRTELSQTPLIFR